MHTREMAILLAATTSLVIGVGVVAQAQPFDIAATPAEDLAAVQRDVRAALKDGKNVHVTLAPGVYRIDGTLVFGRDDSGASGRSVVWRAAKPGTVRIRGGVTLTAEDLRPVSEAAMRNRFPEAVRDRVREVDLSKAFPQPLPTWKDAFTGLPPGPWAYANGRTLPIARWPNEGADGREDAMPVERGWSWITNAVDRGYERPDAKLGRAKRIWPGAIRLGLKRAANWRVDAGVWMFGYWTHDWHGEYLRVASFAPTNGLVRFAAATEFGIVGGGYAPPRRRFMVLNLPEELDAPGEWWFDRERRRFYVLPPDDGIAEITLAQSFPLVDVTEARHLRFENLSFEFTYGTTAFRCGERSEDVVASRCAFTDHGGAAVSLSGRDCRLEDSVIARTGGTAVWINGGSRRWLVNGRNALVRCDVSCWGQLTKASGVSVQGCGNAVRECRIHEGPTSAIVYGGNGHLISDNDIFRVLLHDTDAGAVYTGYDAASHGTLLFGNRLHDLGDDPSLAKYRNGLYFDDCDWGDTAIGNSVVGIGLGVLMGGGSLHTVCNNVFADCQAGLNLDARGWEWKRNWRGSFSPDPKTGLGWAESKVAPFNYRSAPWSVAYPRLPETIDGAPELPRNNIVSNNVIVRCKRAIGWPKALGPAPLSVNTVVTNATAVPAPCHPVELSAAEETELVSPDGATSAWIGLDVAGRLSWRLQVDGHVVLRTSSLGVTVDGRDFGKLVVPGPAVLSRGEEEPATNVLERSSRDLAWSGTLPKGWTGASVPLRDLVTGDIVAFLEARVFARGVAVRWRVPGLGRRFVSGEMTTWDLVDRAGTCVLEADRAKGLDGVYAAAETQERIWGITGVVFPERPRGFAVEGEVVTPWRIVFCGKK